MGADMVELDIQQTKDNNFICMAAGDSNRLGSAEAGRVVAELFFLVRIENTVSDRQSDLVGIPLRRTVERIGVFGFDLMAGVHVDFPVHGIAVVEAAHPRPAEVGVEHPAFAEDVFVADAEADHESVAFAVPVFEFELPVFDVGFREVESLHTDIGSEVPAPVVLLEITAVFAHEDTKEGVMIVYRLPRRNDYFGLEGRFGGDCEFDGGIDYAHERIESVEFDVGLGGNFRCAACCEQACERYFKNEFHSCLAAKVLKKGGISDDSGKK